MNAVGALWKKSRYYLINIAVVLRRQSSFKVLFILGFALSFEVGLAVLFADGFKFVQSLGGVGTMMIMRLFSLFFMGMFFMLVMSGIVTSYATIFRSPEIPFLLVRPFRMSQITAYKFIESTSLSSWSFFFVIIPFVGAFAWHRQESPLFLLWTLLFALPFLVICSGVGSLISLAFVRWVPRGHQLRLAVPPLMLAAMGVWWWANYQQPTEGPSMQFSLGQIVPGLRLASNRLFPSAWVAEGIMALGRGEWMRGGLFWCLTMSSATVMFMAVEALGALVFYPAWLRVQGEKARGQRRAFLLSPLDRWLAWIPRDLRSLIMKDLRMFLRDPMQWSQVLIFFGLLAIYFANLRSFRYHQLPDIWRNMIAFLNVFGVSAVLCSLGSRFVYPQLSLEGQGFWILGLSPLTMTRILVGKFLLAVTGLVSAGVGLMLLSTHMLDTEPALRVAAIGLVAAISIGVCGLSTGLGGIFLDLKQRNPAAIVSGFGGTLNLVLCLGWMLVLILPFGFLFHLRYTGHISDASVDQWLTGGWIGVVVLTLLVTVAPLWLAARSLERRDY